VRYTAGLLKQHFCKCQAAKFLLINQEISPPVLDVFLGRGLMAEDLMRVRFTSCNF